MSLDQLPVSLSENSLLRYLKLFEECGGTDDDYLRLHHARHRATAAEVLRGGRPQRILDIGTHWLHQAACFTELGIEVVGVDGGQTLNQPEVRAAAKRFGVRLIVEEQLEHALALLQVEQSSVDLILFGEIIEHLSFNPVTLWRALYRALAPGGRIVITTPNYYALRGRAWSPLRFFRGGGGGISVADILQLRTYGHHWKEFSLSELRRYMAELSSDFELEKALYVRRFQPATHLLSRASAVVEQVLPVLRPHLHLEFRLPAKSAGIVSDPSWLVNDRA